MATSEKGQAIPFISFAKGKGFHITKEAEQFLLSLEGNQLGVVSITGKYRTGKSFFINRVLLNTTEEGFNVGPTINPCTKGLWLWNKTLKSENPEYADMKILLVDTEGFGGLDENSNHDTRIFIFSLLLSSFFIYNSVGNIDESALNNLSLIINLAKEIQIKSGETPTSDESEEIAQYFPAFLWVVRDFALKLVDHNGQTISSKEYLENALKPQKGTSDLTESKNRVRRMLKHFFRERDCCTMVRPIEEEEKLQQLDNIPNEALRMEFLEQMHSVRKRIFKKVKPKTLNGQSLNGGMLLEVARAYIDAINTGNVPNIENAWTYLCKQESHKAMEESVSLVDEKLSTVNSKGALGDADLKDMERKLKEEMLENFKKKSIGDSEETKAMYQEIEKQFEEKFAKFKERNIEKWKEAFTEWISTNSNLETKLKDQQYSNFYEFKNEMEQMKALYDNKAPKGINKEQFWGEFAQKMYILAAETISKKIEEQANLQNSRLTQKLEMTERELAAKRKEHENERNSLYSKIQETEREKAYFKAQENSMSDKIEHFKHDKEKYERLYNELLSHSKQREDQISNESREKRNELEKKFESVRNESLFKITELEKKNALLEQEMQFIKRDNDSIKQKLETLEREKAQLYANLRQKEETLEEYKRKISEVEMTKSHEIMQLKNELEKKANDLHNEEGKRKESIKQQSEWLIEKSYLESQVTFLKSQLEENKRLHDALLLALEQGLNNNENEGTNELVETNKNLSAAVDKMEMRCKVLEEKNEKLKKYKRMIKNSTALQCAHCSKFISVNVFLQHTSSCSNPQSSNLNKTNLITPLSNATQWLSQLDIDPNALQISINQTMVKENTDSKPYTEYLIQVTYKGSKWSVSRKYKMFCELHQNLNTQFPSLKFPESAFTLLGAFNNVNYIANSKRPTVIEERRKALQQYLRDLAKIDVVRNSSPFKKFLELDRINERESDGSQHMRSNSQMNTTNLTSYREDRRPPSSLISDRNSAQKEEHSRTYSPYGQALRQHETSGYQKDGDKNMLSQSPLSFMKNWQEKAINKENKNPRSRSVIDSNTVLHKMQMDESELDRGDYNDISGISMRQGPEYQHDMSQDRSMNQTSKIESRGNDYNHHRADSSLGFNHPSATYQQSNGYKPQYSTMRPTYSGRNSANQYEAQSNSMMSSKYNVGRPSHQAYQRE